MNASTFPLLRYNYAALLSPGDAPPVVRETGLAASDLTWLAPRLASARHEVLDDLEKYHSGGPIPEEKRPLDAAFLDLPDRLLGDQRAALDQLVATGDRLAKEVDRVVVLGIGGSYMGARALFEACCHPFHNELSRKRRGGRPRIYFEGNNVDNDATQGLLDLVDGEDDWAIIVISKSGGTMETAVAFRVFLDALRRGCQGDDAKVRQRVVAVTGREGMLRDLARVIGCKDDAGHPERGEQGIFDVPEGVGGRYSVLSPVGLLPAAVMGLDVVKLLEGAAAMNRRFRTAAPLENPALDYAGMSRLMETRRGATIRVLSTWGKRLEAIGLWYDQLLSESLGKKGLGATPLTVVNTRDLHSRGQQHQEGRRDKLITNLYVEHPDREPVAIPKWLPEMDQDKLNQLAGKALPEVLAAARTGTNAAYAEVARRTADIVLPRLDEPSLGQLLQMLMLATVVEGRLVGINPFGQPGVEAYKKKMIAILRGK